MCWPARAKNSRTVRGRASRRALSSRSTTALSSSSVWRLSGGGGHPGGSWGRRAGGEPWRRREDAVRGGREDGLSGGLAGQLVKIALHDGGGVLFRHGSPPPGSAEGASQGVHPPRLERGDAVHPDDSTPHAVHRPRLAE